MNVPHTLNHYVLCMHDQTPYTDSLSSPLLCAHRLIGEPISLIDVIERLVVAADLYPTSKIIACNHYYAHQHVAEKPLAVMFGKQHLSFHPMLVRLDLPVPVSLECKYTFVEDDEFAFRIYKVPCHVAPPIFIAHHLIAMFSCVSVCRNLDQKPHSSCDTLLLLLMLAKRPAAYKLPTA